MLSFRGHLQCACTYYEAEERKKRTKRKRTSVGDKRMVRLKYLLDNMGFDRSDMQRRFHRAFAASTLGKIYEKDQDVDFSKIAQDENFESLKQSVVCSTPRRFGKTTGMCVCMSTSMFNSALFSLKQQP